jgi:hypothetical protein
MWFELELRRREVLSVLQVAVVMIAALTAEEVVRETE